MTALNKNIKARSLKGVRFYVPQGYVEYSQGDWGLWDETQEGWVTFKGSVLLPGGEFQSPYIPAGGRKAAKAIEASGLTGETQVVRSGINNPLPRASELYS